MIYLPMYDWQILNWKKHLAVLNQRRIFIRKEAADIGLPASRPMIIYVVHTPR